MAGVEIKIYI